MMTSRLLPDPGGDLTAALAGLPDLLQGLVPLKPKHRRLLPFQVAELSALLTVDREDLPPDYMNRPPYLAAYLRYFLPWNLMRQTRLLQGLGGVLDLKEGARILDLGAGPLTFPAALWLARNDLRARKLHYTAVDRSEIALRAGRGIFAGLVPESPWSLRTVRGDSRSRAEKGKEADLLVLANVLNELDGPAGKRRDRHADSDRMHEQWLSGWSHRVCPGGMVLIIEPGIRTAGRMISRLRQLAMDRGWSVLAPCPHAGECPQPGTGRGPWCHFSVAASGAPQWLLELGEAAELPKQRLSLSFLLLRRPDVKAEPVRDSGTGSATPLPVRIMSDVLSLPGGRHGVYGCCARGLVLVATDGYPVPRQGDLWRLAVPVKAPRDRKSGALLVSPPAGFKPGC